MNTTQKPNNDIAIEIGKKIGELNAHSEELKEANFETSIDEEDAAKWGTIISNILKSLIKFLD